MNKTILCIALTYFMYSVAQGLPSKVMEKVDFDKSMGIENKALHAFMFRHKKSKSYYAAFKSLFDNNFDVKPDSVTRIPKIMHQLWVGDKPLPKFMKQYISTCKALHPDWEYKLWTQNDLENLEYDKKITAKLKNKWDIVKDYFMFLILQKYGGVFLDVDSVCFKPLDELTHKYDAWFILETPTWWKKIPGTAFSIAASKANHEIINDTLNGIRKYILDDDYRVSYNSEYGSFYFSYSAIYSSIQYIAGLNMYEYCKSNNCQRIMVFPSTYFTPTVSLSALTSNGKYYTLLDKLMIHFWLQSDDNPYAHIAKETIVMNDFNAKTYLNPIYHNEKAHEE